MSELGRLLHDSEEDTYLTDKDGSPVDPWGERIHPDPKKKQKFWYEEDDNGNLWKVYSNGLGYRV